MILFEKKILDKPTPSEKTISKKFGVSKPKVDKLVDKGAEEESEHTSDKKTAKEIAKDHIGERPDYYDKLKSVMNKDKPKSSSKDVIKSVVKDKLSSNKSNKSQVEFNPPLKHPLPSETF